MKMGSSLRIHTERGRVNIVETPIQENTKNPNIERGPDLGIEEIKEGRRSPEEGLIVQEAQIAMIDLEKGIKSQKNRKNLLENIVDNLKAI